MLLSMYEGQQPLPATGPHSQYRNLTSFNLSLAIENEPISIGCNAIEGPKMQRHTLAAAYVTNKRSRCAIEIKMESIYELCNGKIPFLSLFIPFSSPICTTVFISAAWLPRVNATALIRTWWTQTIKTDESIYHTKAEATCSIKAHLALKASHDSLQTTNGLNLRTRRACMCAFRSYFVWLDFVRLSEKNDNEKNSVRRLLNYKRR